MINRNHAEQIRACERIKFDQALYILTMYQKKIRKSRKALPAVVDADTEMQDIISSWKNKWKMDLTKPILNCVTSVYPRVLVDPSRQDSDRLAAYYSLTNRFIGRLRAEHEDETNFKLVLQAYDKQIEYMTSDKYQASSKATVKGLFTMARDLANAQLQVFQNNVETVYNDTLDINTESAEWQVWRPLRWIREIAGRVLVGEGMEVQNDIQPKSQKTESLIAFCANVVRIMERIKQSEHGSTLVTIQPRIDELTLLFHPLLVAVAANFKKENHEKTKDYKWAQTQVQSIPMMENPKSSYNCSRVVVINLDGYQSEFNLQLARNFKRHLLYISFPKEEAAPSETARIHSHRFFKKLMFRYSQALFQSFPQGTLSEDYRALTRMERLMFNPQDYHCCAQKLYDSKNDKGGQDFNQNLYVFPVRLASLRERFPQVMQGKQDIQNHESYFIRFMIKDFLLNQIREFNPTLIMLSYSGRLHIEDHHFVEILQELTKIANYKLLLFPNLTSAFVTEDMIRTTDKDNEQCDYDNFTVDPRIGCGLCGEQVQGNEEQWTGLFDKMMRFLKVSSGTYNLNRSFEEEPLVSKYKNQFILGYIDELMTVLGKEYPSIDKIRFRNKDLSILPKLFEENIRNIKKTFDHTVPRLYADVYDMIEYLLLDREIASNPKRQQLLSDYGVDPGRYREFLDRCSDQLARRSGTEVVGIEEEGSEGAVKERHKRMREVFNSLKQTHLFEISSEKFEEKANVFIKMTPQNKEFAAITEETQSLRGLFEAIFYLNPGKITLKLYQSTKLLYQVDQRQRKSSKIPILVMNNLTEAPSEYSFQNYYAQMDIANAYQGGDKKNFEERRCQAIPLVLQDENGQVEPRKRTWVLSDWSFHESQDYLVLFWPTRYDFFQAFLHKLIQKPYQPHILSHVYLSRKGSKTPTFRRVSLSDGGLPARVGASCYEFQGKVFVFGGFYEREKNYLELQHDIVTMDLQVFEANGQTKLPVQNIKGQLYGRPAFQHRLANHQKPNSFVRPRMEFQFFQREQLLGQEVALAEEGVKTVIMLGGYGQNFLRPYSLLTYYYYTLRFDRAQRTLASVQKRIIYNKAIPVNTREMTKNLGVIKTNRKTKTSTLQTKKLTEPDAYTLYRNSFKIEVKDGQEEFNYKFKYMFSEDEYRSFKHQIKKIQEIKAEQFDSSCITVERDPKNNHRITLQKDSKKREVQLRMEIPAERARKIQGNPKEVSLTHESIIHLDVWNSNISAIVRHDKYTQGRSVLLEYSTKALESFNFEQDSISHLAMSWAKEFDRDLSLHILIICNKNTVAILHGQKLARVEGLKQYIVKRKKNDNVACQIRQRQQQLRRNEESPLINTVFFRHRNKIMAIDFIALADSPHFYINCQEIELTTANQQFRWTPAALDRLDPSVKYEFCIAEKNFIRMQQLRFLEFYKSSNDYFLVAEHNRKRYVCEVGRGGRVLELLEEGAIKIEPQNMERGSILVKTEDKYIDRDFL